jgi:RHS repeat-associated protein
LWVARGIELDVADTNNIYAVAYDDAGNTASDLHDTIALENDVALSYTYDSKGNLIQKVSELPEGSDTTTFEYFQNGLLKRVYNSNGETETYYYNPLGQRYKIVSDDGTTVDTRTLVFNGSSVIRELQDSDTVTYENFSASGLGGGIGSIVYQEVGDDTITFYTYNHKGDVFVLIDENEDIAALYEYDAFGNVLTEVDNGTDNNFTFSTREFSEVSGLGHWPVREYDSFAGRWTRLDPAGDVDGLNLYVFVGDDPVNKFDQLGKWKVCCRATRYDPETDPWWAGWIYPMFRHCDIAESCRDSEEEEVTEYDIEIDSSSGRKMGNGKSCDCVTAKDVKKCLEVDNPYSPGRGEVGSNCQSNTIERLAKCCLKSNFKPNWFAGSPRGRCLEWEYILVPNMGFDGPPVTYERHCKKWEFPNWQMF